MAVTVQKCVNYELYICVFKSVTFYDDIVVKVAKIALFKIRVVGVIDIL